MPRYRLPTSSLPTTHFSTFLFQEQKRGNALQFAGGDPQIHTCVGTNAALSKHARNFLRGRAQVCDVPTMDDQLKRPLVITRSSNVIACFVLNLAQHNVVGLVQGGGLTFHHQSKCNRMRQCLPDDCGALVATNLQHTSCDPAAL